MPLPKALQAQADAAEATLRQVYPDTHGAVGQPAPVAEPVPPIPLPALQASEPVPPAQPQPLVQPQPPQSSPQQSEETWEQRYRTLQGIIVRQNDEFKQRMQALEETNRQLLDRVNASQQPAAQPQPAPMDPQDAETFGEDLVRMIRRNVDVALAPLVNSVEQRLSQLESNLTGTSKVVAQTADESFFAGLRREVPDFDQINTSEPFLTWLAEVDDLYGQPRQAALTAAGNARDLARVVGVFKAFKRAAGIAGEQPGAPSSAASRLQAQVSPQSTGNGAAPQATNAQGKPMITVEQVERFYSDVRRGAYRGNDQLRAATEAVINDALADNRIVQRGMHRPAL